MVLFLSRFPVFPLPIAGSVLVQFRCFTLFPVDPWIRISLLFLSRPLPMDSTVLDI